MASEVGGESGLPFPGTYLWWLLLGVLVAAGLLTVIYWFVGTIMLGLFFYYAAKPVVDRLDRALPHALAAPLALLLVVLPFLATTVLVVLVGLGQLASVQPDDAARIVGYLFPTVSISQLPTTPGEVITAIREFLSDPSIQDGLAYVVDVLGVFANAVFHVMLALAFGFYLLRDDARIERWFRTNVAGEETAGYRFLATVNRDLKAVFFVELTIVAAAILVTGLVYQVWNLLAPATMAIPQPLFVALVTGTASILPLVGRGIVYLGAAAYMAVSALRTDPALLTYPVGFLFVMFGLVDNFLEVGLRPRLAGRHVHSGIMLFAYVLGVALFGWYGVFYGPFLVVVAVEFVRLAFPDVVEGRLPSIPRNALPPDDEPPSPVDRSGEATDGDRPGMGSGSTDSGSPTERSADDSDSPPT